MSEVEHGGTLNVDAGSMDMARKAYEAVYGRLDDVHKRMARCVEQMSINALGAYNAVMDRSTSAGREQAKIYEAGMFASLYFVHFNALKCIMSEDDDSAVVKKAQEILDFMESKGWCYTIRIDDADGREMTKLAAGVHVDMCRYLETRDKLVKATEDAAKEMRK